MLGAPAAFLREDLSPELTAAVLSYRLTESAGTDGLYLLRQNGGLTVRAATTKTYGRLHDYDLYSQIDRHFGPDSGWSITAPGVRTQCDRSDRDSNVTLINTTKTIDDPSGRGLPCYRALRVRNSEVGLTSVSIWPGTLRALCSNLQIWAFDLSGATWRRRHVGTSERVLRDTLRQIYRLAHAWADRPAAADEAIIRSMIRHEIAHTEASVIAELAKLGLPKQTAAAAYQRCITAEPELSPRSVWGVAQGLTRLSQDAGFGDERHALDQLAGKLFARYASRVAA
jgi:hypothetical protein